MNARQLDRKHDEVRALVQRIRRETRRRVPDIDPGGPGMQAAVLLLFRAPNERGSLKTGLMSFSNPDATAAYERELMQEAGLSENNCVSWNAIPWDIGDTAVIQKHRKLGALYLRDLLRLFDRAPVIVAHGGDAHAVCRICGVGAIEIPMTSPRGLYGGGANRRPRALAGLRLAARRSRQS